MKKPTKSLSAKYASHPGQSMLEVTVALPFLLLIVIGIIEFGIIFASDVSLVNATREGAIFASMYPKLADTSCGSTPNPACVGANDTKPFGVAITSTDSIWEEYVRRVNDEIVVVVGDPLRSNGLLLTDTLSIDRPILGPTSTSCPTRVEAGCFITITVHYYVRTFTSDISLPVPRVRSSYNPSSASSWATYFFGILGNVDWSTGWRMGIPNSYQLNYTLGVPIR